MLKTHRREINQWCGSGHVGNRGRGELLPVPRTRGYPWSFETEILDGGYVEEVFNLDPGGGWRSELVHRLPGETYHVDAAHIHRIVELPTGECWTLVRAGPHTRETRFWRFRDIIQSRAWHERRWTRFG